MPAKRAAARPGASSPSPDRARKIARKTARAESEVLAEGSVLGNRFEIVRHVYDGGMSRIYKAVDRRISSYTKTAFVAIKVLRRQLAERAETRDSLRREMARVRHLTHPNIISVYDFDEADGRLFLVMEWLDGESVQDLLLRTRGKRLDEKFAWRVIDDTAKALQYAHDHNVVHADINPGNIFITDTQAIKLLDFGLARVHQDDQLLAPNETVWATRRYASPEVLAGLPATFSDDVFSLGCVAYRLLSGKHAFGGLSSTDAKRNGNTPKPLADLDREVWQHLARTLSFDRAERPDSVDGFRRIDAEPPAATPSAGAEPARVTKHVAVPRKPDRSGGRRKKGRSATLRWTAAAVILGLALFLPYERLLPPEFAGTPVTPEPADVPPAGAVRNEEDLELIETPSGREAGLDETTEAPVAERPAPQPQAEPAVPAVDDLLARADRAMTAERYTDPGGDSARALYRDVLDADPDNAEALSGLRSISDVFVDEARSALDAGAPGEAFAALDAAAETDATNPAVAEVRGQLAAAGRQALSAAETAVATGDLSEASRLLEEAGQFRDIDRERIADLRSRAESESRLLAELSRLENLMASGRLIAPPGDNAHDIAMRLGQGFPEHPRYVGAVNRLGDRLITEAVAAARGDRFPAAEAYVSALDDLGIMATETDAVRTLIAERRQAAETPAVSERREAAAEGNGPPAAAGASSQTGTPPNETGGDEITPFSELRFERYVAPSFPSVARDTEKSGFVELRFKVLPDGTTQDIQVLAAEPGDLFIASAEEAVRGWEFARRENAVSSQVRLSFAVDEDGDGSSY